MHASACTDRLIFTNAFRFLRRDLCDSFCRTDCRLFENKKKDHSPYWQSFACSTGSIDSPPKVLSCPCSSAPAFLPRRLMHLKARKPSPDSGAWTALQGHADRLQSFTRSDLRNAVRRGERVAHRNTTQSDLGSLRQTRWGGGI